MKTIASAALCAFAAALLTACGGTKSSVATAPPSSGEFDPSTGAWKPLTKVVTPPPPQGGAVIAEQKKPGVMNKIGSSVGKTLKKPLDWVGLSKSEPRPAATAAAPAASAGRPEAKP